MTRTIKPAPINTAAAELDAGAGAGTLTTIGPGLDFSGQAATGRAEDKNRVPQ
jgi:hypothetical protein